MDDLIRRKNRAAESILENEALTDELDDTTAKALLDWGVACAEMIAQSTAGLDDSQADEVLSVRLRAIRRLIRGVSHWIARRLDTDVAGNTALLNKIVEQATIIYGQSAAATDDQRHGALSKLNAESANDPPQVITDLRHLFERSSHTSSTHPGVADDRRHPEAREQRTQDNDCPGTAANLEEQGHQHPGDGGCDSAGSLLPADRL